MGGGASFLMSNLMSDWYLNGEPETVSSVQQILCLGVKIEEFENRHFMTSFEFGVL